MTFTKISSQIRRRPWQRMALRGSVLVVAFAFGRCVLPGRPARGESSQPLATPAAAQPERGRGLYARHCASCHGPTGRGDGEAGRDLDPLPINLRDPDVADTPPAKLFRQITRGRRPMPSFGRLMSEDERWAVVAFVKSLNESDGGRKAP